MKAPIQNEKLKRLIILFAICACAIIVPIAVITGIVRAASGQDAQTKVKETVASKEPIPVPEGTEVTSKGYAIEKANGVTYINGILVVNKTYPLPKTYNPGDLTVDTQEAFDKMQTAAANDGVKLWVQSGFRTYARQKELYNFYVKENGVEYADAYSARPGYSEHQSGLSFDVNESGTNFDETKEGQWIEAHAHEYGFIIRFPQEKAAITGYEFEPWHLRYLGVELATELKESGQCLEEYLGITSEYK